MYSLRTSRRAPPAPPLPRSGPPRTGRVRRLPGHRSVAPASRGVPPGMDPDIEEPRVEDGLGAGEHHVAGEWEVDPGTDRGTADRGEGGHRTTGQRAARHRRRPKAGPGERSSSDPPAQHRRGRLAEDEHLGAPASEASTAPARSSLKRLVKALRCEGSSSRTEPIFSSTRCSTSRSPPAEVGSLVMGSPRPSRRDARSMPARDPGLLTPCPPMPLPPMAAGIRQSPDGRGRWPSSPTRSGA